MNSTDTTGGSTDIREFGHELWSFLTGKEAVIEYTFTDMTVEVPRRPEPTRRGRCGSSTARCGSAPPTETTRARSGQRHATAPRDQRACPAP